MKSLACRWTDKTGTHYCCNTADETDARTECEFRRRVWPEHGAELVEVEIREVPRAEMATPVEGTPV